MRIVLTPGALPRLDEATDFRRFCIEIDPDLAGDLATAVLPVADADASGHAWVRPDAVRALAPVADRAAWEQGFAAMVAYAQGRGWTDGQGRIRAHVELSAPAAPAVPGDAFRRAMRRFASGVCVVATGDGAGRCGMTVSAFSSVSAEPPMVLVCINRTAASHDALTGARVYSINILGADQRDIAMVFAGQAGLHGAARFDGRWSRHPQGAPVLDGALHSLICARAACHHAGSHSVLIGRVIDAMGGAGDAALVNFEGILQPAGRAA